MAPGVSVDSVMRRTPCPLDHTLLRPLLCRRLGRRMAKDTFSIFIYFPSLYFTRGFHDLDASGLKM